MVSGRPGDNIWSAYRHDVWRKTVWINWSCVVASLLVAVSVAPSTVTGVATVHRELGERDTKLWGQSSTLVFPKEILSLILEAAESQHHGLSLTRHRP